jgi:hypothetical protein
MAPQTSDASGPSVAPLTGRPQPGYLNPRFL